MRRHGLQRTRNGSGGKARTWAGKARSKRAKRRGGRGTCKATTEGSHMHACAIPSNPKSHSYSHGHNRLRTPRSKRIFLRRIISWGNLTPNKVGKKRPWQYPATGAQLEATQLAASSHSVCGLFLSDCFCLCISKTFLCRGSMFSSQQLHGAQYTWITVSCYRNRLLADLLSAITAHLTKACVSTLRLSVYRGRYCLEAQLQEISYCEGGQKQLGWASRQWSWTRF